MTYATFATGMTAILDDFDSQDEAKEWCDGYRFLHGGRCVAFVLERNAHGFWQIAEVVK